MQEIPEARALADQINTALKGQTVAHTYPPTSPHKFAFFNGEAAAYDALLAGSVLQSAHAVGGNVEIIFSGDMHLQLGEGICLHWYPVGGAPEKYQLKIAFDGGGALTCTVQMYGGMWLFKKGENNNPYYAVAVAKPSPLEDAFDEAYFNKMWQGAKKTLSAKAFLAAEQRIPGLGNGVLQDILFDARIHPKTKLKDLGRQEQKEMYKSVKTVLAAMAKAGGRDTERDIYGNLGGYKTLLCSKTLAYPCPRCGGPLVRQAYLGGNIYVCPTCQPQR